MAQELFIVSPTPGEVLSGSAVQVIVKLPEGIRLVNPEQYAANTDTDGHLHFWLDALPRHDDLTSVTITATPEYTYTNIFSGLHTLRAELVKNDHTPFVPPITAAVEFETMGQPIKKIAVPSPSIAVPPDAGGGLFIPRGSGNTALALVFIALAMAILWFVFERKKNP